jgi:ectoine hydroxylase-related dioxygenase (phytanoyl-CoA dioxygenase family)
MVSPVRLPSPDELEAFHSRGFFVRPDVFTESEVRSLCRAFDRLERTARRLTAPALHRGAYFVVNGSRIDRIVWCGAAEPVLLNIGADPRLLAIAAGLLGSAEMSQLINQAHFKLPGDGVAFPWHQDSTHRRYGTPEWTDVNGRGSYVQTVIALDDVTEENGPLEFIPGSCRSGHLGLVEGVLPPGVDAASAVAATMRAGSVLVFGPYAIHRSLPNGSAVPRRIFINGYAFPGANARVYPGEGAGRTLRYPGGPLRLAV